MSVRTVLRQRVDQVFRPEAEPAVPTFWDNLTPDERKESVDQRRSWEFNSQHAWNPAGRVANKWSSEIYPNILLPLFRQNSKKIFRGVEQECGYDFTCWMVGSEWDSAHPAAIVQSGKKEVTKNGVKLIKKHGQLQKFGFEVYGFKSRIMASMATKLMDELYLTNSFCAVPFCVEGSDEITPKYATLGGVVIIDGQYFGLTVLHPFIKSQEGDTSESDDDSDLDDEETCTSGDSESESESAVPTKPFKEDFYPDMHSIYSTAIKPKRECLGIIPKESEAAYWCLSQDWALVKLRPRSELILNFITFDDRSVFPCRTSSGIPERPSLVVTNSTKPQQAETSSVVHGLYLPHIGLQKAYVVEIEPTLGNSGSWLVDSETESIFGMVIAGSVRTKTSYFVPSSPIFKEIWRRFPDMQFPLTGDLNTLNAAITFKKPEIVRLVLQKSTKVQLNSVDKSGSSPLYLAVIQNASDMVSLLIEGGADPTQACAPVHGMGVLHHAAYHGFLDTMKIILDDGMYPDSRHWIRGETPLQAAVRGGNFDAAKLLLDYGAYPAADECPSLAQQVEFLKIQMLIRAARRMPPPSMRSIATMIATAKYGFQSIMRSLCYGAGDLSQGGRAGTRNPYYNENWVWAMKLCDTILDESLVIPPIPLNLLPESPVPKRFVPYLESLLHKPNEPRELLELTARAELVAIIFSILYPEIDQERSSERIKWEELEIASCLVFWKESTRETIKSAVQKKLLAAFGLILGQQKALTKDYASGWTREDDEWVQFFLDKGADPDLLVVSAIERQCLGAVDILVKQGADLRNINKGLPGPDRVRLARLLEISTETAKELTEGPSERLPLNRQDMKDLLDKNTTRLNAITLAIRSRQPEILRIFLERGANPEKKNYLGISPLDVATALGEREMVEILQQYSKSGKDSSLNVELRNE